MARNPIELDDRLKRLGGQWVAEIRAKEAVDKAAEERLIVATVSTTATAASGRR